MTIRAATNDLHPRQVKNGHKLRKKRLSSFSANQNTNKYKQTQTMTLSLSVGTILSLLLAQTSVQSTNSSLSVTIT